MLRGDEKLIKSFLSLRGNDHFSEIIKWVADNVESEREAIILEKDTAEFRQCQGRLQVLCDFLKRVETARDDAEKMKIYPRNEEIFFK